MMCLCPPSSRTPFSYFHFPHTSLRSCLRAASCETFSYEWSPSFSSGWAPASASYMAENLYVPSLFLKAQISASCHSDTLIRPHHPAASNKNVLITSRDSEPRRTGASGQLALFTVQYSLNNTCIEAEQRRGGAVTQSSSPCVYEIRIKNHTWRWKSIKAHWVRPGCQIDLFVRIPLMNAGNCQRPPVRGLL